ncbi:hypothetical protein Bca101_041841 [Brassica carinata]
MVSRSNPTRRCSVAMFTHCTTVFTHWTECRCRSQFGLIRAFSPSLSPSLRGIGPVGGRDSHTSLRPFFTLDPLLYIPFMAFGIYCCAC